MEEVEAIIIGSGQGGSALAANLARVGNHVIVFEKERLGGSCLNYGCYPSKALLAAADAAGSVRRAAALGVEMTARVDFAKVMERVRRLSAGEWIQKSFDHWGVHVVKGEASFAGERIVTGGGVTATAPLVVINTGNAPYEPPIPGLAGTPFLTYKNFWNLSELPSRLLILGGGYIGVELGQGMARLGSETHIIEKMDRIIAREEADVSEVITAALRADGVRFHLGAGVENVRHQDGVFSLTLDNGESVAGEALLVAVGQAPNTSALAAAAGGIELDERGFVRVDERFQTSSQGVFAIGDVTGQPAFTHVSWEDHRRLLDILNGGSRTRMDRVLGYGFFTDPEVGRAGLTIEQAQAAGLGARSVTLPLSRVARAYLTGREDGFYRMVVDTYSDRILGATLVGPHAAELVHVFLDLIETGQTWQSLERAVHIHPTLAEGLPTLARLLASGGEK